MKVVIDGVFNHMGYNSFIMKDLRKNGKNSRFKDWITIT